MTEKQSYQHEGSSGSRSDDFHWESVELVLRQNDGHIRFWQVIQYNFGEGVSGNSWTEVTVASVDLVSPFRPWSSIL